MPMDGESINTTECNCWGSQQNRRAQNAAKLTTSCDCKACDIVRRKLEKGLLQPKLTGAVAHTIAQKLVSGTINAWELPLAHKQLQRGLPELVYLAGMTFIASHQERTPPFSKAQIDFFNELQKLFNLKKNTPLKNPALFTLNEFFVPPQQAQNIINVQIMRHQTLYEKQTNTTTSTNSSSSNNNNQGESLQTTNTNNNNNVKRKRGKKKNAKKKKHANSNMTEELRPAENNEWLEKLQQVLHTQNGQAHQDENGQDFAMLCQPVVTQEEEEDATTTTTMSNTTPSTTIPRLTGARNCAALYQDVKLEADKKDRASFVNFTVEQFHALVAQKGPSRYGVPLLQRQYSSDDDDDDESDENPLLGKVKVEEITPLVLKGMSIKERTMLMSKHESILSALPFEEMSLMANEEVAEALSKKDNHVLPLDDDSSEQEESKLYQNGDENESSGEATVQEQETQVALENGATRATGTRNETKETPVDQQDESVNDDDDVDNAIQKEPQVAEVHANADSTQQQDTKQEVERLQDQLKRVQSKLEEKDFMLEVQTEMLAEKEAALKTQEKNIEEFKTLLQKEQEANVNKTKLLAEKQTLLEAQKTSMDDMRDLLNRVQATNKELLSNLKKSDGRNRALQQAFQQYNSVVAKIEQSDE